MNVPLSGKQELIVKGLVVADTTPLNYLILIEAIGVLPVLFQRVCVPMMVAEEMSRELTPKPVRAWIQSPPAWVEVWTERAKSTRAFPSLDAGESEALHLAMAIDADFVLIDERQGTKIALELGLRPTGTLAILEIAAKRGVIDLPSAIDRLQATNFRYPKKVVERLLAEDQERRGNF